MAPKQEAEAAKIEPAKTELRVFTMRALSLAVLIGVHVAHGCTATCGPPVHSGTIDFDTQVIPVLTRQGCNAGSCHGAAIGRGGFKLSLLGSGGARDYDAIVQQLEGRRVNLADPEKSLLLRKPSEQLGHEGGLVLPDDSPAFELIQRWISEGAIRRTDRKLTSLVVNPNDQILSRTGETVSVRVAAAFSTGETADVTQWTVFQPGDPEAVSIQNDGRQFTVHRRGVHVVIARFLDRVLPIRLTVPMHDAKATLASASVPGSRIDQFVDGQLSKLNLPASPPADDWQFVRRVTLDLTGRLPTPDGARGFAEDTSGDKRSKLIRELLASDSFADYWALKWANHLGIDSKQLQAEGAAAYHRWIAERLREDAPVDETARMMVTSAGDSYVHGAVNFLRSGSSPGDLAEHASRIFLGVRLRCANCHDHPLDHWKQDDYHGLAAIFAKVRRGRVVTVSQRGEVTHPVTGQPAVPRIPSQRYLDETVDGRVALADWLTSPDNPYFAKAMVNRLWQQLMGRGLVDPVDDLRTTNPATHPELLEWLAADFVEHGFRVKHTIELICNSNAYGRDSSGLPGNSMDTAFYSHALIKPLEAEVVADAIADVTGVPLQIGNNVIPRTVRLTDNRMDVPGLSLLGRCDRETTCTATGDVSLSRSLHLINGELINKRLDAPSGRLNALLASTQDDAQVLDEIFLSTLAQSGISKTEFWQQQLATVANADRDKRAAFFADVLWSLLTSKSFASNH
jgi:hypothetical protein